MKTKLLFTGMLALIGLSAQAQNAWGGEPTYSGAAREGAVGFCIGSKIYIGTGTSTKDFWEFDTLTGGWKSKTPYPGNAGGCGVGFAIGNKGYVGTGNDGIPDFNAQHYYQDFWEFDTAGAGTWTQKLNFPGGLRAFAVGFSICGKGYVGCGYDGSVDYDDFYEFDPTLNSWTAVANFSGGLRYAAVGFSIGDTGYVGTGSYFSTYYNDFYAYDPSTNTWTAKGNFGGVGRTSATGFSIGNKGYIGTGTDGTNSYLSDFWEWNQATNTWTQKTNYTTACDEAVGISNGRKGYIGTGFNGNPLNNFSQYIPSNEPIAMFIPSKETLCAGSCISFKDTSTTAPTNWSWTFQGSSTHTSNAQNPNNVCFDTAGNYTVILIASNCIRTDTAKLILSVNTCTGIDANSKRADIVVYPNPSSNIFTIESSTNISNIEILNVLGEKICSSTVNSEKAEIDLTNQPKGIYFYKIVTEEKNITTGKLIVE